MFAEERRNAIVEMINKQKKATVQELCDKYTASPGTIRTDLQVLEDNGLLKRTHGGAISINRSSFEQTTVEKDILHFDEKKSVARAAVNLIDDGDTIVIDTGTTLMELAKLLYQKKNLTVVTNDLKIAMELDKFDSITVNMIGGTVRHNYQCTYGPQAIEDLSNIYVDKTFLATNGFSIEAGITTPDISTAEIKKQFIKIAGETHLLCDSSKFGRICFKKIADISDLKSVITDRKANPEQIRQIQDQGVHVITE